MSQWTSVCAHAHTDYGLASTLKIVQYAVSDKPTRPCYHVAMVPVFSVGSPNVTKLRGLAREHPTAVEIKVYDPTNDRSMEMAVKQITEMCGDSGVNLLYTCPDWCEEAEGSGLNDTTEESLSRTFHHNCVVPVILSKLFYPALQQASKANPGQTLNRRRAAIVHLIGEAGTLGDFFSETRGQMYGYSASLSAMIMSMKTMSYELNKRNDGILVFGVITNSPHVTSSREYDVIVTRDLISQVVHAAGEEDHGKCLHYKDGKDVSY